MLEGCFTLECEVAGAIWVFTLHSSVVGAGQSSFNGYLRALPAIASYCAFGLCWEVVGGGLRHICSWRCGSGCMRCCWWGVGCDWLVCTYSRYT